MTPKLRFFIQTFAKFAILFLSAGFLYLQLWDKISTKEFWYGFSIIFTKKTSIIYLFFTFCLMFFNWALEVLKWKKLTSTFSNTSTKICFKGVISGITISMFLPNRTGDFAGRILWLRKRFRWKGLYANIYSSSAQVLATMILGISCILLIPNTTITIVNLNNFGLIFSKVIGLILLISLILLYFLFPCIVQKTNIFKKENTFRFIKQLSVFSDFKINLLSNVLVLSILRFFIYCFQFFLVLKVLQVNISLFTIFPYIAVMYFFITIVPKFAIVEIATRGAIAIMIIGTIIAETSLAHDISSVLFTATTVLWIINLFIPAMLGLFFLPPLMKTTNKK